MSQLIAITKNTYLQTIRQPLFGIIVLVTLGGLAMAPSLTGWTLDDDDKMLRDLGLSTLLVQGLFLACMGASSVINTEIEDRTVLSSVSKPISRPIFIVGKYLGILGGLLTAHLLAGVALFMVMRHGVLQMASQHSDITVLLLGPGLLGLILVAAGILNYVLDWRFLPTVISIAVPAAIVSSLLLLVVDREWKIQGHEVTQTMDNLPQEVAADGALRGIIEFRPLEGHNVIEGHRGLLVRKRWQGPITDEDRTYLLGLSEDDGWKRDVDFLVKECRTAFAGVEIFKAGVLTIGAIVLLAAVAVAVSTRFGMITTFVVCILLTCLGLTSDHFLLPLTAAGGAVTPQAWAEFAYPFVPNLQVFWMVDALAEERIIPWSYIGSSLGYAALCAAAFVTLGIAMFETREVG